jgi:hypothetical protein
MERSGLPWASRSNCKKSASYSRSSPHGKFPETGASNNDTSTNSDLLISLRVGQLIPVKVHMGNLLSVLNQYF